MLFDDADAVYLNGTRIDKVALGNTAISIPFVKRGAFQSFSKGAFGCYTGMWGTYVPNNESMVFTTSVKTYPNEFPAKTRFDWNVTPDPDYAGINGYLHVNWGNYDYSPGTQLTSRQVYTITTLTVEPAWTFTGDASSGLLCEFWLTSGPVPYGSVDNKTHEIAYLPKPSVSAISWHNALPNIGTGSWTDSNGITWSTKRATAADGVIPYLVAMRTGGAEFKGKFLYHEYLAYLINNGSITGNEWFNGLAFGVEPEKGIGSVTIDSFPTPVYTGAARAPWAPTNFVATPNNYSQITLSWRAAAGATSHQYRINNGTWTNTSSQTGQVLTGLTESTTYTIDVRGVNATGQGSSVRLTPTTPVQGAAEMVLNGGFNDDSNWNGFGYSGKSVAGGKAVFNNSPAYDGINQPMTFVSGKYYDVKYTISNYTSGNIYPYFTGGTLKQGTIRSGNGTFVERIQANAGNNLFNLQMETGGTLSIDDVSVMGPYSTADIPTTANVLNRWKAADLNLANASLVQTWPSRTSTALVSQATSGNRPSYRTNILAGKPVVRFDGNDSLDGAISAVDNQPYTLYILFRVNSVGTTVRQIFFAGVEGQIASPATTTGTRSIWSNAAKTYGTYTSNTWELWTIVMNGSSTEFYVNGTLIAGTGSSGNAGFGPTFLMGRHSTNGNYFAGDIAEFVHCDGAHDATQRAAVRSYITAEYGI